MAETLPGVADAHQGGVGRAAAGPGRARGGGKGPHRRVTRVAQVAPAARGPQRGGEALARAGAPEAHRKRTGREEILRKPSVPRASTIASSLVVPRARSAPSAGRSSASRWCPASVVKRPGRAPRSGGSRCSLRPAVACQGPSSPPGHARSEAGRHPEPGEQAGGPEEKTPAGPSLATGRHGEGRPGVRPGQAGWGRVRPCQAGSGRVRPGQAG
jgi:hypothetical protein